MGLGYGFLRMSTQWRELDIRLVRRNTVENSCSDLSSMDEETDTVGLSERGILMPRPGRGGGKESKRSLVECLVCFRYHMFYALYILSHLPHRRILRGKRKIEESQVAWRLNSGSLENENTKLICVEVQNGIWNCKGK